ncbi:dihydrolipoamide acetyltransferase family protein [Streptomyces sp. B21-083]|uniref:dihydrolipoamide acetyltransferase family protein n=1 Tax=Streptomyces sp. B21-083 TaxID=3039410 RepID=UPI002FF19961
MHEILMPRLSDTMEEGTLARWLKEEGDQIHKGDVIAEIETDKALMDLEAYDEGPLTRLLVPEGSTVPIGTAVAVIGDQSATTMRPPAPEQPATPPAEAAQPTQPEPTSEAPTPAAPAPSAAMSSPPSPAEPRRVPTSPLARRIAGEHGIDIDSITGSGPGGRIVRADVEKAIAPKQAPAGPAPAPAQPAPAEREQPTMRPSATAEDTEDTEVVPLSTVRRLTAQRLTQSAQQAPHFYLTAMVDAEPLLAFRTDLKARIGEHGPRVSVNDLIIKACATALRTHPEMNASWDETRILHHHRIHIGIAVALDDGLTVPVIHDADRKTLTEIAREARTLADKARAGHLSLDNLADGTFTISNLGPYGIDHFTAVINPPQAAILAVGAAHPEPVVRDGELAAGTVMALTLAIDHRAVDGATGAVFLTDLKALLEQPMRIVV